MKLVALILLLSTAAFTQEAKNPVSNVLREMLPSRAKNTVGAIEEMPADKFNYKPTPEQMTFGHLAAHITDGNYFFCSNGGDVQRPNMEELQRSQGKGMLVAPVKRLF